MNAWTNLLIASFFEVIFAAMVKMSAGGTIVLYAVLSGLAGFMSFVFLNKTLLTMELSLAYPVWTGIGLVGSILLGVFFFNESLSVTKFVLLTMLCISMVGLSVFE